jgi:hypothetical protein
MHRQLSYLLFRWLKKREFWKINIRFDDIENILLVVVQPQIFVLLSLLELQLLLFLVAGEFLL